MEQHQDEQLACADCGASFVFSAGEAAVFEERGLSAPKRCKDCRRARKDRSHGDGHQGQRRGGGGAPGDRNGNVAPWAGRAAYQGGQRRYTGDVNEYRSPMQTGSPASFYGQAPRPYANDRGYGRGRAAAAPWQGSGEYRSPMPDGFARQERDARPRGPRGGGFGGLRPPFNGGGRAHDGHAPQNGHAHQNGHAAQNGHAQQNGHAEGKASRKRPPAEMFSITCDACGAAAEVPFKPAEGREVYCPTCYRARRPQA